MKISNKAFISRKKIVISALIIVLLGGSFFVSQAILDQSSSQDENAKTGGINYDKPTQEQQDNGATIKGNSTDTQTGKPNASGSDQPPAPAASDNGSKKIVEVTISAAKQNGDTYQIRAFISKVTTQGSCTLKLAKTGQTTITQTVGLQPSASISACKLTDVSVAGVAKGNWQLTIDYSSDTLMGSETKSILIQ